MNGNEEIEIDLILLCRYIISKWLIIVCVVLVGAGTAAGASKIRNKEIYETQTKLYITIPITSDKVVVYDNANELVQDYLELIKTDLILKKVAKETKLSLREIKESVDTSQVEGNRFIIITVQNSDKSKCVQISKVVLRNTENIIADVLHKDKPIVVEQSLKPLKIDTVKMKKELLIGAGAGFAFIITVLLVLFICKNNKY